MTYEQSDSHALLNTSYITTPTRQESRFTEALRLHREEQANRKARLKVQLAAATAASASRSRLTQKEKEAAAVNVDILKNAIDAIEDNTIDFLFRELIRRGRISEAPASLSELKDQFEQLDPEDRKNYAAQLSEGTTGAIDQMQDEARDFFGYGVIDGQIARLRQFTGFVIACVAFDRDNGLPGTG